ncbi:hypothetical protein AB0D13_08760 [Streptomyces sp. NPDC048430]|uniref:hypothetical protein n=1 Tax=unclassified Streptomyces TaxID=2593676 RepID=UPI0034386BCC
MRRPGWLTALVLAVTLVAVGTAEPAEAAGEACATAGSNFASQSIAESTAALRMGCARDAGSLRSLAGSDADMVAAIAFNTAQRPGEWQRQIGQMVDTVRAEKDKGLTLSESFDLHAQKSNVDFYDRQIDVRFDGSIRVVGDSLFTVASPGRTALAMAVIQWDRRGRFFVSRPDESPFGDLADRIVSIGDLRQHLRHGVEIVSQ